MNAFQVTADGYVLHRTGPDTWRVVSPSGASYLVEPQEGRCSCPAGLRTRRRACKHLKGVWALLRLVPGLDGYQQQNPPGASPRRGGLLPQAIPSKLPS